MISLKIGAVDLSFKDREVKNLFMDEFEYKTNMAHNAATQLDAFSFAMVGKRTGVVAEFNYVPNMPVMALRPGPGEGSAVVYAKGMMKDKIVINHSRPEDFQQLVDELGALHEAGAPPDVFDAELEAKISTYHPDVMIPYTDRMNGYLALVIIGKSLTNPLSNVTGIFWGPDNRSTEKIEYGLAMLITPMPPLMAYRFARSMVIRRGGL